MRVEVSAEAVQWWGEIGDFNKGCTWGQKGGKELERD